MTQLYLFNFMKNIKIFISMYRVGVSDRKKYWSVFLQHPMKCSLTSSSLPNAKGENKAEIHVSVLSCLGSCQSLPNYAADFSASIEEQKQWLFSL